AAARPSPLPLDLGQLELTLLRRDPGDVPADLADTRRVRELPRRVLKPEIEQLLAEFAEAVLELIRRELSELRRLHRLRPPLSPRTSCRPAACARPAEALPSPAPRGPQRSRTSRAQAAPRRPSDRARPCRCPSASRPASPSPT